MSKLGHPNDTYANLDLNPALTSLRKLPQLRSGEENTQPWETNNNQVCREGGGIR